MNNKGVWVIAGLITAFIIFVAVQNGLYPKTVGYEYHVKNNMKEEISDNIADVTSYTKSVYGLSDEEYVSPTNKHNDRTSALKCDNGTANASTTATVSEGENATAKTDSRGRTESIHVKDVKLDNKCDGSTSHVFGAFGVYSNEYTNVEIKSESTKNEIESTVRKYLENDYHVTNMTLRVEYAEGGGTPTRLFLNFDVNTRWFGYGTQTINVVFDNN